MYITLLWLGGGGGWGRGGALSAAAFREMALSYLAGWNSLHMREIWVGGLLVYPILLFSPSPMMTELLLTGTLIVNSINQ